MRIYLDTTATYIENGLQMPPTANWNGFYFWLKWLILHDYRPTHAASGRFERGWAKARAETVRRQTGSDSNV